ncbi:uncharacterized protein [Hyperolius riggenbachi]|uniref:uncharacterized protein n=1 Tax=Hyperolius riggenbachi TaxID=752182 RepID=UPI0035A35A85
MEWRENFPNSSIGLTNAPATFQRLMESCLGEFNFEHVLIYLDDIIVYSTDFHQHIQHLDVVFQKLRSYGLKLKPSKCHLFKPEVNFLGHVISKEGVKPNPEKVKLIKEWPVPTTIREVRAFLGIASYYRRFIPHFAQKARPLHFILKGAQLRKKNDTVCWNTEQQKAFDELKAEIESSLILAFADFHLPFRLYTDASNQGLGAVLTQEKGGKERVIAFASRSLRETEKNAANYSSFRLELLAVVWAVTEKFSEYLNGVKFTIYTDNNPVAYLQTAKLGAMEQRWVARLAKFQFTIKYRPGRINGCADALSRFPYEPAGRERDEDLEEVEVPLFGIKEKASHMSKENEDELMVNMMEVIESSSAEWQKLQEEDHILKPLKEKVRAQVWPKRIQRVNWTVEGQKLLRQWDRLRVENNLLVRKVRLKNWQNVRSQIVLTRDVASKVITTLHEKLGHPGPEKIAWCFRKRFYCLQMEGVIKKVCRECLTCNTNQGTEPKPPLVKWRTSAPLEVVAVDFLSLDTAQDGRSSVLVMIDHFTKFAVAVPTRDQTAVTAAKHLWNDFIQTYGCPQRIHSDQGPCFESRLMQELCQLYNIKKSHTTPYHPQGNGVCERFNRTLIQKIRSLEQEKKQRWPVYIKELVWAYNHTVHDATGYAPFHLFFGREDGGPLDVLCGRLEGDQTSRTMQEWVENHKNRVQEMYDLVRRSNEKESETFERRWNFQVGDIVLLRNKGTHEKGKLTSRWGADLWKIVNQPSTDIPVYDVQKMDGTGPIKRVNGALLKLMSEPKPFGKSKNCEMELEEMVPCWVPVELSSGLTPQAQRNRDQNLSHPVDEWQDVSGLREESSGSSVESERGSDADQQVEGSPELEPEGSLRRSSRENIGLPPKRYLQEEFICARMEWRENFPNSSIGLTNAPATFQRLMESCLGEFNFEHVLIYLDDIIVYSTDFHQHIQHLDVVFQKLRSYGLKLKPSKCHLFKPEVNFLGHVISKEGVKPNPEKVKLIKEWPVPTTIREVRAFLGIASYYRRFIPHFAQKARPLHFILKGAQLRKKNDTVCWNTEQQKAFDELKAEIESSLILAFADFHLPFRLYTDASNQGLGAVLTQEKGGKERVIAFASRSLRETEKNAANYSSFRLELLAVVWAVTEKFSEYLNGVKFTIYTDNNPVAYLQTAKLGAMEQRWVARLAKFQFTIKYRPGRINGCADALSRFPYEPAGRERDEDLEEVEVPLFGIKEKASHMSKENEDELMVNMMEVIESSSAEWQKLQEEDHILKPLKEKVRAQVWPKRIQRVNWTVEGQKLLRQWDRLRVENNLLVRKVRLKNWQNVRSQIVLTRDVASKVITTLHEKLGHPGPEKIAWCFRKRFYCLQMEGVIKKVCRECLTCNTNQGTEPKPPLVKWRTSAPLEVVAVDFLSLDTAQDGRSSVLVMIDHFTKFAVAVPTRDQTAVTAAKHLWNDFIQTYGCPQRIHSDQGPCFESRLMQELCQLYNIKKSHTTPYHPQGNGVCERFNRTLIQKIRSLEQEKKQRWPVYIKELVWAYNHTVHDATGYAPFHLFFGREDGGPLDVLCGRLEGDQTSRTMQEWVENHKNRVQEMYDLVRRSNEKESETFERRWNFQVGDIVLLRNKGTHEKGKLTSRWGADLWKIVNQPSTDIPVYDVQKMDGTGPIKRVNGALLKLMSEPKPFGKSKNCEMELEEMVPCWVPVELSSGLTPQAQRNRDQNLSHPVDEWQDVSGLREESSGSSVESERGSDADQQVEGSPELEPEGSLRRSSRENIGLPPKRYLQEEFIWQQRR